MEETSEELPNFSIGIDLLGPDPTSSKNKAELKKTRKLCVSQISRKTSGSKFWPQDIHWKQTDTNWSSTTFKGKISIFIVVFKVVMPFCYLRTIRLKQENFSRNNNTNYSRRHKLITHKNNCRQVFSGSRNDQPMFVNEYKFKEGWQLSSLKTCFLDFAEQNVNIFSANPNHTPRLLTNMLVF